MILITGASGTLGKLVTEEALKVFPAEDIAVSVRDASKVQHLADKGVTVREADFKKPETLKKAFENISQLVVVSANGQGQELVDAHKNVINAAKEAGVDRLLYTSQIGSAPKSHFQPMVDHYNTEQLLEESGLNFIALRHGFYAASGAQFFFGGLHDGKLYLPKDGPVNWTTHEDLAEGLVKILQDKDFSETYPQLTAKQALTMEDIAHQYDRSIERIVISDEQYKEALDQGPHLPDEMKQMFLDIFHASVDGDFDKSSPLLQELLGREPKDIVSVLKEQK